MRLRTSMLALVCAALAVFMLTGCSKSETPLTYMDQVDSTDLSAEKGGAADLGISEQELVQQKGKPFRTLNDGGRSFIFMYSDYQYTSVDSEVVGYALSPDSMTAKGLKLGASKADVLRQYGGSFYTRGDGGSSATLGYVDKTNKLALEFELKDDLVKNISVTLLKMYE